MHSRNKTISINGYFCQHARNSLKINMLRMYLSDGIMIVCYCKKYNNRMKHQFLLLIFTLFLLNVSKSVTAQNCGVLDSVTHTIVDNGNGTSNYTFVGYFSTTSGGSKSVDISIYCGSNYFVTNDCVGTTTSQTTKTYGPFNNVTTCTGTIFIDWIGKTTNNCGGSTCGGAVGITPVTPSPPLPVKLVSFEVELVYEKFAKLNWETASEINNDRFEVQRKLESESEFVTVGEVRGVGNSTELNSYEFTDNIQGISGKVGYRLKQVDYDNEFEYSKIQYVDAKAISSILVYPNPASNSVTINSNLDGFNYEILNSVGLSIVQGQIEESNVTIQTTQLQNGVYFVRIKDYKGLEVETMRLFITK